MISQLPQRANVEATKAVPFHPAEAQKLLDSPRQRSRNNSTYDQEVALARRQNLHAKFARLRRARAPRRVADVG